MSNGRYYRFVRNQKALAVFDLRQEPISATSRTDVTSNLSGKRTLRSGTRSHCFISLLGNGKRLFGEGTQGSTMRMVDHLVSSQGVIVATYEPAGEVKTGTFPGPQPSEAEIARRKAMTAGTW